MGQVTDRLAASITAERDQLRQAAASTLARADAGQKSSADARGLLHEAAIKSAMLAELAALNE